MVPSGNPTEETVQHLGKILDDNDIVIDGGNTKFHDDYPPGRRPSETWHSLCRRRNERRYLGITNRLLSDGRWGERTLESIGPDSDDPNSGEWMGTCGRPWRWALREDGPQWH
jgi:hypothetical protein